MLKCERCSVLLLMHPVLGNSLAEDRAQVNKNEYFYATSSLDESCWFVPLLPVFLNFSLGSVCFGAMQTENLGA